MAAPGMHSGIATDDALNLSMSEHAVPLYEAVKAFIANEVEPITAEYYRLGQGRADHWGYGEGQLELLDGVKAKAKANGLWNFFLPNAETGEGLSNLDYAYIAQELGKSPLASECLNCSAPDTGNMEVLERVGTEEQKERWLKPLLAGEIRSAYAMTEPDVASSDAKNIACRAVLDGDEWLINGEKYYISGRRRPALQDHDRHGPDEPGRAAASAPVADPRADGHAGRGDPRGRWTCSARTTPRTATCTCASTTCACRRTNILLGEGRGFEISPGPARTGPHPPLHALDRRRREGARADGPPRAQPRGVRQAPRPPRQEHRDDRQGAHRDRGDAPDGAARRQGDGRDGQRRGPCLGQRGEGDGARAGLPDHRRGDPDPRRHRCVAVDAARPHVRVAAHAAPRRRTRRGALARRRPRRAARATRTTTPPPSARAPPWNWAASSPVPPDRVTTGTSRRLQRHRDARPQVDVGNQAADDGHVGGAGVRHGHRDRGGPARSRRRRAAATW